MKTYVADFETSTETTSEEKTYVWGYGVTDIDNTKFTIVDNSLDKFMKWCSYSSKKIYFHNLKFDGTFIVTWLYKNGFKFVEDGKLEEKEFTSIISKDGLWYSLKICFSGKGKDKKVVTINDSLKKLPMKVSEIAKAFDLEESKLEIDYDEIRSENHTITEEEKEYIIADVIIVAKALKSQFDRGMMKLTVGSDALNEFKFLMGGNQKYRNFFPILDSEVHNFCKGSYKGGWTYLNPKYAEKDIGNLMALDVNSLYPSVMRYGVFPYGLPLKFEGKYQENKRYPLYIQKIETSFTLKEGYLPIVQIKETSRFKGNEYLTSSMDKTGLNDIVTLTLNNVDLEMFLEHYDVNYIRYIEGYMFKAKTGVFNDYIDKWYAIKEMNSDNIPLRTLAKLMLNSLYGKFGSDLDVTQRIPIYEDGKLRMVVSENEKEKSPEYMPMASFITSYARQVTINMAQKLGDKFIYSDTDSVYFLGNKIPKEIEDDVDNDELGKWGVDGVFKKGRFIKQKTYIVYTLKGKKKVTCAGMSETVKEKANWNNFFLGLTLEGNLKAKQVDGGTLLKNTTFRIG